MSEKKPRSKASRTVRAERTEWAKGLAESQSPMTSEEFQKALDALDLTARNLAEIIDVSRTSMTGWVQGKTPVPITVTMLLAFMLRYPIWRTGPWRDWPLNAEAPGHLSLKENSPAE
jgi:hypothetical protein